MTYHSAHRRFNRLTGEWVAVSPHRTQRPWQGRTEAAARQPALIYDPSCYLCPGNRRVGGEINPDYSFTYSFTNDFPAFLPASSSLPGAGGALELESPTRANDGLASELLQAQPIRGTCRVLCFSPRHDLTLANMSVPQLRQVVDLWVGEMAELGQRWRWVQIFENRGEAMGCSNPHPHGQVWASDILPNEPAKEWAQQRAWFEQHGRPLLLDYVEQEWSAGERIIAHTPSWVAVIPWWALWPFEVLILPRRAVQRLPDLSHAERDELAQLLRRVLRGYDALFDIPFPYSMGWHGAPTGDGTNDRDYGGWQLHAHIYPPLLRSASVRKFMVGYEMFAEPQRDLTPEAAAERLRGAVSDASDS